MHKPRKLWRFNIKLNISNKLMFHTIFSILVIVLANIHVIASQSEDDGIYRGKELGKLNTYHHQVTGDVYAVDEYTLLFVNFNYDGNGADAYFWAGASNRPGPQGFIVPDKYGKTNILERHFNDEFILRLPDNKKLTEINWFAIYDLNTQNTFGDVYIPEDFEPPVPQKIGSLTRLSDAGGEVSSGSIEILDSQTMLIPGLNYNGRGLRAHFWSGEGPAPSSKGFKVPDELGYLDPIRPYHNATVKLELPGDKTIFNINWFSIYDLHTNEVFGSIFMPEVLNVPPSLTKILTRTDTLPNCRQLHKYFRVSWEVFGPQVTLQLTGQVEENDYMAFGISGSQERSQMIGSDIVVAYIVNGVQGFASDYNVTSLAPCVQVLGQNKGVCRDDVVGGMDSYQLMTFTREKGVNTITFRRTLISSDEGDKEYVLTRPMYMVWALGQLDSNREPAFHSYYPKRDVIMNFNPSEQSNDCFSFKESPLEKKKKEVWDQPQIFDRSVRSFTATLGPPGGNKGYSGLTGHVGNGLAWYINGLLIPELWLRRGLTYVFKVRGGNNPHSAEYYHPMVITDEPRGGFDRLTEAKQSEIRVLAGVEFTRRGRPKPTAAGPLCLAKHKEVQDRRLDDNFPTFKKFNKTLESECDGGDAAVLEITPNSTWPDTVYYNSFTQANMGWKIHIVDSYSITRSAGHTIKVNCATFSIISLIVIALCCS